MNNNFYNSHSRWLSIFILFFLSFLLLNSAQARRYAHGLIEVDVISERNHTMRQYPVSGRSDDKKTYVEAKRNMDYSLRIRNNSSQRLGVVVTVDGRNIISGKKSYLKRTERMYILKPYGSATYRGWRTGKSKINRFYFTESDDSYAAAWGDKSAMGVIAVAAFKEKLYQRPQVEAEYRTSPAAGAGPSQRSEGNKTARSRPQSKSGASSKSKKSSNSAGTGYGQGEYSPIRKVNFQPKAHAAYKVFIKYEWRDVLCRKGIISCYNEHRRQPNNRFWDNGYDYAPPPPSRYDRW